MAIDANRILREIEKQTAVARSADPAKARESIAAIRALCNLVLDDEQAPEVKPHAIPLAAPQVQTISSGAPLKEDDANGDSLFEF